MALHDTISGSTNNNYVASRIRWEVLEQNIIENYSVISIDLIYIASRRLDKRISGPLNMEFIIDGTSYKYSASNAAIDPDKTITVFTTPNIKVYHNMNGTLTSEVRVHASFGTITTTTLYGFMNISRIEREADFCVYDSNKMEVSTKLINCTTNTSLPQNKVTDGVLYIGKKSIVQLVCNDSRFDYTVDFYINDTFKSTLNLSGTGSETNDLTSQSSMLEVSLNQIPDTWIPSALSDKMYIQVSTFYNGEQIGYFLRQVAVYVPDEPCYYPRLGNAGAQNDSMTLEPSYIGSNKYEYLLEGKNYLLITFDKTGWISGAGSELYSIKITGPSIDSYILYEDLLESTTIKTDIISSTGDLAYKITIEDARGRQATIEKHIISFPYVEPTLFNLVAYRSDNGGNKNARGTYLKCVFSGTRCIVKYNDVDQNNIKIAVTYYQTTDDIKEVNAQSATQLFEITETYSADGNISFDGTVLFHLDDNIDTNYKVYAHGVDKYEFDNFTSTITVQGGARIINIAKDGTAIAFGQKLDPTDSNIFKVNWDTKLNKKLTVDDNAVFNNGITASGNVISVLNDRAVNTYNGYSGIKANILERVNTSPIYRAILCAGNGATNVSSIGDTYILVNSLGEIILCGSVNVDGSVVYTELATFDGSAIFNGAVSMQKKMQCGYVNMACTTADVTVKQDITFATPFSSKPIVVVSPTSAVPQIIDVSPSEITATGFTMCFRRSNTNTTGINWIAMAKD